MGKLKKFNKFFKGAQKVVGTAAKFSNSSMGKTLLSAASAATGLPIDQVARVTNMANKVMQTPNELKQTKQLRKQIETINPIGAQLLDKIDENNRQLEYNNLQLDNVRSKLDNQFNNNNIPESSDF